MDQRISFITLAVEDIARSRRFFVEGLGWSPMFEADDVIMLPVGEHLILSLWSVEGFTAEIGEAPTRGNAPIPPPRAQLCDGGRSRSRARACGVARREYPTCGASRLGRVFGLLLRPRRISMGDRYEPRTHRRLRPAVAREHPVRHSRRNTNPSDGDDLARNYVGLPLRTRRYVRLRAISAIV